MDWKKQTAELISTMNDAQRSMWSLCTDSIKTVASAPVDEKWVESVTAAEKVLTSSVNAQSELMNALLDRVGDLEKAPESASEAAQSIRSIVANLSETQQKMLATWFELLRSLDPGQRKSALGDPVQRLQDMARQAMDTQLGMLRAWTGLSIVPEPAPKAKRKTPTKKKTARKKTTSKKKTATKKKTAAKKKAKPAAGA